MSQTEEYMSLEDYVGSSLATAQAQRLAPVIAALKAEWRGHARAILFYGSCLGTSDYDNKVLDFYILVDSYRDAYKSRLMAAANRILPPNVFYREIKEDDGVIRCKVAVLSLKDFERRSKIETSNISIWARFSQPSALVYADGEESRLRVRAGIAECIRSMVKAGLSGVTGDNSAESVWISALTLTYGAELRSEGAGAKARELFEGRRDYYEGIMAETDVLTGMGALPGKGFWAWRRVNGKAVSLSRLIKAAFTFDGGAEYLAWKIERHSGVKIELTKWQRRHPVLGGLYLFLSLRRRGAFR